MVLVLIAFNSIVISIGFTLNINRGSKMKNELVIADTDISGLKGNKSEAEAIFANCNRTLTLSIQNFVG